MDAFEDPLSLTALLNDAGDDQHPVAADFEIPEEYGRTPVAQDDSPISSSSLFRVSDVSANTQLHSGGQTSMGGASSNLNIGAALSSHSASLLSGNNSLLTSICDSNGISEKNSMPLLAPAIYQPSSCSPLECLDASQKSHTFSGSQLNSHDLSAANDQLLVGQSQNDGNLFSTFNFDDSSSKRMAGGMSAEYHGNNFIPASPNPSLGIMLHQPAINGASNHLYNNFQSNAPFEHTPATFSNDVSGDRASRSSSTCSSSQPVQSKSNLERTTSPLDGPTMSPLINGNYSASDHSTYNSRNVSRNPSPVGDKCANCVLLKKKLNNSKQWNKFLKEKLIITDKLFQRADDLERDHQRYLELQLAYDQRTREWRYQQEQLVTLLQEVQPLKEKLAEVEKELAATKRMRTESDMAKHALQVSCEQYKARIDALSAKVNPLNQEIMEKKLQRRMAEIRRLRTEIEVKNTDIHDMKAYIRDHKLFYERQNKKSLWALGLAKKLSSDASEAALDEETRSRLQCTYLDTQSNLVSQYEAFRRTSECQLEGDFLGLSLIPSFEQWLDDFDRESHSQWDFNPEDELKSGYKYEKSKKKRLDSGSSTGQNESIKSVSEDAQKNKNETPQATEQQKAKKKRGPYKKKTPEEKKAVQMAGAKIEKILLGFPEANNTNNLSREGRNENVEESSSEKSINKEAVKQPKSIITKNSNAKSIKVHQNPTAASDSDEYMDCPSPSDNRFFPSPPKQSVPSDSGSLGTFSRSLSTNSALPKQSNSLDARRKQPFEVSEKSLFGDDSSDDGSDTENASKNKLDRFPRDDRPRNLPSATPTVTASDKKMDGKEQRLHSKPLAAKEGLLPIGRSIHGVAKVSRVFDRQVVSSCVKRGNQQRPFQDEPIKLGALKKPLAPSYNVKEIGNLMRERMKEKQTVLTGGGKSIRAPPVPSATPIDAVPTVCKRRSHSVLAPVKSKSLPDSNSLSAASKGILSMEEKSLTKYKSQNQDPSMFSSSDSSDNEGPSHSSFSRSRVRSPVKISKNSDKSSSEINESSVATVRPPPKPRASQPIETSQSVSSVDNSPAKNSSKSNHNQIEHRPVVSKANISLNGGEEDMRLPIVNPEDLGAKTRPTECDQSNKEKEKTSPQKLSENTQPQLHETNLDDEAPAENVLEHDTVVQTSFLQNENQVTEIDTHFGSEHSDDQRSILSDDLAMSSDSEDNDEEDFVKTTTAAQSPVHRAAHAIYAEDFNLSDASPERPSRPPSIPLRDESPSEEQVSPSTAQSTLEATTKDQLDIRSKDHESSRTSTPIKKPARTTLPLDISDVVRSLSLDDSHAPEARDEMKQNSSTRAEVPSGSVSGQINTDNVRVASIFDDEDSCFTPMVNEPSPSQVSDGLTTSKKVKIPTAYAGLNLSLTDDETDDSDGEDDNIRTSINPSEFAAERISSCDNANKVEKSSSSAQLSVAAKSNDEETLEDSVFIGNDEKSSTSVANSHVRERSFNSRVVSDRIEQKDNLASFVNVDTKDSPRRNSSPVESPGYGAFDNDEHLEETLTCTDRGESKSPSKEPHDIGSLSNLRSDSERSIDKVGNVANSHEMSETPLRNAGDSSDNEKRCSTDLHPPAVVDTCAQSDTSNSLSKSSSPVRRITRVRSQSSSSTSRKNCSSADSKADFGSPLSYRLRKRVSSHDSENESTPSKALSSKRLRIDSNRKSGVRCRDNSFSLNTPTKTPDQTLDAESISAEPCERGRVTRRNSTRNTDHQKEDIRSIFDVLKSPKFSSETQNFNLPSEITVHPTEVVSVSFNDGESSKMPHCSGSTRASSNAVRSQPSPASSECSSAADLVSPSVRAKGDEGTNNRAGFLPPVVVQTRRSSRQRRGYSSSTVSRSIAQERSNSNKDVNITDSAEIESTPAETQCSKGPENKHDPSHSTTDLLHGIFSDDVSSSKRCMLQLTPEPTSKLNLSLTSEDESEIMSSYDQKSDVLAPDSELEKCSLEAEQKKINSSTCGTGVADSSLPQKAVSGEKEKEEMLSDVQKPLKTLNLDSQHMKLKPNENAKKCTAYGASLRANSCVSNSKTSIPAKPSCEVDPTSRVTRRRKAMVFKSIKRVIVGTPPRRNLQQNKKRSLGSSEDRSRGCVDEPVSKSESGKEKSKNSILSPAKSDDSDEGSRKIECLLPKEYASHQAHKLPVKNDAPEVNKSENSTKIPETNKFQNSIDDSESPKSFDNRRDLHPSATKSISSKLREPIEPDSCSSPPGASLEIDTCVPCINEVDDDSESEGEMCINIEEIEIEAAISTVKPSPPFETPSSVPRAEPNKNLGLFDEDEFTCSDENQEERKRQSSQVQGKRKRLCPETEVRLELNAETSKSKQDLPQVSESQSKKHKPSSIEKLPPKSFETKPVMMNSAPRPAIGKKGSFSVSQLQELERRKQTASKAANSVAPVSRAKVGLTNTGANEQGFGGRSSSKNTNDSAKTQSGDGTSDVHSVRSKAENGKERKKLMVKDRKPLAKRTARLSKSAAAAATAAARRTMTGQRPKASHVKTVKRSVPSSDDNSSDELNVKRTPGRSSMLIESDSEPETTPLGFEKSSKVPKTCEERVSVNGNKCLDLNSVVQNMSQKFGIAKKKAILLEGKTTAKPSRSTPAFNKPCVNYTVKETEVNGREHSKNSKTNPHTASSSSSHPTESYRDQPISEHRFASPTTSYTPGVEHSDDEFILTVDLGACNSSVNCYDAAETHSTTFSASKPDPDELGSAKTSAYIRSAEVTTNDVNTSRVNFNSVTVPTGVSKVAPAFDLKPKTAPDNGERRNNQVSAENSNLTLVPAAFKPMSFFGKDLLTSANSDDDELSESSEMSPDSPSSAQELSSNPPTSMDSSEYCPSIRVPSVPVNLSSSLETAQLEYSSVLRDLVNVRIGSAEWKTSVITIVQDVRQRLNENSSIPTCTYLQLLARAFIESIMCVDPTEDLSAGVKVLCPELYKLFMLVKVIESNLNVTPTHSLEDLITSMCENLVRSSGFTGSPRKKEVTTLTAGAIASLCSWHTASCCVAQKEDRKPQWRRARAFVVSLLCHYPGLAHGALLSSLFLGRFVLLRLVKYRSTTGLERVIMWLVHHGTWTGKSSVRTLLIDNMNARYACENSPAEPMVLVRSILDGVLNKVDKHTKASLNTFLNLRKTILGLMVLSCWKGKAWLLNELLPYVLRLLASKKHISAPHLCKCIVSIACTLLPRVGVQKAEIVDLLHKAEEENGVALFAAAEYKDQKLKPDKALLSKLLGAFSDALRMLLHDDTS